MFHIYRLQLCFYLLFSPQQLTFPVYCDLISGPVLPIEQVAMEASLNWQCRQCPCIMHTLPSSSDGLRIS